jgi:site-specific DNA recombinase
MEMHAVIYARVSSREQEETGYSLPAQQKFLEEYAAKKQLKIVHVFAVAESASGGKQRRTFEEMMAFLQKKGIKVLICEKTDRLTRSRRDAVVIDEWVRDSSDREVHFAKENFILSRDSRANEKFIWGIKVEVAQYYINNLSEEVRKGQRERRSNRDGNHKSRRLAIKP